MPWQTDQKRLGGVGVSAKDWNTDALRCEAVGHFGIVGQPKKPYRCNLDAGHEDPWHRANVEPGALFAWRDDE